MKSSLGVLGVLLCCVVVSVEAASVPPTVQDVTDTTQGTTDIYTTTAMDTSWTTPYPSPPTGTTDIHTTTAMVTHWTTPYPSPPTGTTDNYHTTATDTNWTTPYPSPPTATDTNWTTPYPSPPTGTTSSTNTTVHTASPPRQATCPDGWEEFQGRCYYFVSDQMTWPQAQSKCALLDSMLVSVHSVQEYSFLQQLSNSNGGENAWLGGFYLQDQWLWLDGSWFYNSTSDIEAPDSSSPCLTFTAYGPWINSPCDAYSFSSICVKNPNVLEVMCPEGWVGFQGRCYRHNYVSLTWAEADAECAALEASLVSVHSPQEYAFLYQQASINGIYPTWLGGFYLEGQWLWLDGSWFYQGFFSHMSPDSTNQCLFIQYSDGWSNYNCDQTLASFCVKDAL